MYVCTEVYMYMTSLIRYSQLLIFHLLNIHIPLYIHTYIYNIYIYIYIYIYTPIHTYNIYIYICILYIYTSIHTYIYICRSIDVCSVNARLTIGCNESSWSL